MDVEWLMSCKRKLQLTEIPYTHTQTLGRIEYAHVTQLENFSHFHAMPVDIYDVNVTMPQWKHTIG